MCGRATEPNRGLQATGALLLGYPIVHLIAHVSPRRAILLLALVFVPFWPSLLVRTVAPGILLTLIKVCHIYDT